jgi:hypothetical protein
MSAPPRDWAAQRAAMRALVLAGATPRAGEALFRFTDAGEVVRAHDRLIHGVLARKRRGVGTLAEAFAATLAGADLATVAREFVRSPWFARHGELPDRPDQLCAEEAFYRYLCDAGIGDPEVRRVELVDAMIRALAVQPRPCFRVPPPIERTPHGYLAVISIAGRRIAFATAHGRVLRGPESAVRAALPACGQAPEEAATDR